MQITALAATLARLAEVVEAVGTRVTARLSASEAQRRLLVSNNSALVTALEMAVQKLLTSGVFEGTSAAAIVDMINKEKAQKQADALKQMQATAAIAPPAPAGPPGAAPPKGPPGAKAAATLQSIQSRGKGTPPKAKGAKAA